MKLAYSLITNTLYYYRGCCGWKNIHSKAEFNSVFKRSSYKNQLEKLLYDKLSDENKINVLNEIKTNVLLIDPKT